MSAQPEVPKLAYGQAGAKVPSDGAKVSFDFDARLASATGRGASRPSSSDSVELKKTTTRRADLEMVPKPTTLSTDPLNWSRWRKELAFGSLMLGVATIGILKTMLVTVNSVVATEVNARYTSITALTGVPLILGALAGLKSQMLSECVGKRGIYLGSASLMLVGALWNMHVYGSYGQFMVSRIFQGIGWGMYEALVSSSIADMFFVHERTARMNAYNVISICFTWGSPILGGYVSQSGESYRAQLMIVTIIQAFSIVLLILGTPETTFDRYASQQPSADTAAPKSTMKKYLETLKMSNAHSTSAFNMNKALRPLKVMAAPSAILAALLTAPLLATAYGVAQSLSLLFSAMPTFLFPSRLGFLFILPLVFSLLAYTLGSFVTYLRTKPPNHLSGTEGKTLTAAGPGLLMSVIGLLAFGLYTSAELMPEIKDNGTIFALQIDGVEMSLKTVSALFGLLVSGAIMLQYSGSSYLSTFASSNGVGPSELAGAHHVLQELFIGIWVIGMPMWVSGDGAMFVVAGLKNTSIALGVLSIVFGTSVGAILWVKGDVIRSVDRRVVGKEKVTPLQRWKTNDSFFEA